jgi:hypothetical protein
MMASTRPWIIESVAPLLNTLRQLNNRDQYHALSRILQATVTGQDLSRRTASQGYSFSILRIDCIIPPRSLPSELFVDIDAFIGGIKC